MRIWDTGGTVVMHGVQPVQLQMRTWEIGKTVVMHGVQPVQLHMRNWDTGGIRIVMYGALSGTCRCDSSKGLVIVVLMHAHNDQKDAGRKPM